MPLYAFGSNGSGQLGIGHKEDVSHPVQCLFRDAYGRVSASLSAEVEGDYPVRVAAGGNHTLVLFSSGALYAAGALGGALFGAGDRGSSHERTEEKAQERVDLDPETVFRKVILTHPESGRRIDRFGLVAATWEASFLIPVATADELGEIYVFGTGAKGELGLGDVTRAEQPCRIANFIPAGQRIMSIDGCMTHAAVVLSDGSVYGWGASRKGQLGDRNVSKKIAYHPTEVTGPESKAQNVTCGKEFTAITTSRPESVLEIFGPEKEKWGIKSFDWGKDKLAPVDVRSLAASWHGIYIHKKDGSLLVWGRNDRGQIPPDPHQLDHTSAEHLKLTSLAVGSEHILALTETGKVLASGWGEHGNCGSETDSDGDVKGRWAEIALPPARSDAGPHRLEEIVGLGAGCATSWILTATGSCPTKSPS